MLVKAGTIAQPTSAGSVDITLGWECKGIFFWCDDLTADGNAADAHLSFGFANASANRVVAFRKVDDAIDVQNTMDDDSSIKVIKADLTVLAEASVSAIDSTKVTVTWSTADAVARVVHYLAIGGAAISSTIGNIVLRTTAGTQDITGLPFTPDIVFAACANEATLADPGITESPVLFSFGVGKSATSRFCVSEFISHSATDTGRGQRTDLFIRTHLAGGSSDRLAVDYNGPITNGFQLDVVTNAAAVAAIIPYIAFSGGDWEVGTYLTKASTGTDTKTGVAFTPKGLLIASWNAPANTAAENDVRLTFGMATGAAERGTIGASAIAAGNDSAQFSEVANVYRYGSAFPFSTFILADFDGFTSDGWTLDYTTASATQRQVLYVAMGGAEALTIGAATETDTALARPPLKVNKLATETDTAFALSRAAKTVATGVALETDEAFSRIVKIIQVSDPGTITLTWDANTEPDLAGYKVFKSLVQGEYTDPPIDVGNVTTYTFLDLPRPATYYFVVTAYDNAVPPNESAESGELIVTLGEPASEETDTALSPGVVKSVSGIALETDTALAPAVRPVPLAEETDEALALAYKKIRATGLASETDEAFGALTHNKIALETDEAFALPVLRTIAVGLATETDSAFAGVVKIIIPTVAAEETDTALRLVVSKAVSGISQETDTALAPLVRVSLAALETDEAFALAVAKLRATGVADETDEAFALIESAVKFIGSGVETDEALALAITKIAVPGIAEETDEALALAGTKIVATGLAEEVDVAFAIAEAPVTPIATGLANETDEAFALVALRPLATGTALETDTALALTLGHVLAIGMATETDAAPALTVAKARAVGIATETDTAFAIISGLKQISVGLAEETDSAFGSAYRLIPHTIGDFVCEEIDTAYGMLFAVKVGLYRHGGPSPIGNGSRRRRLSDLEKEFEMMER